MGFFSKLQEVDRRILYVIMAAVIIYATIKPMGLPIKVGSESQTAYDFIQGMPAGAPVVVLFNFDSSGSPELMPASIAMIHHCLDQGLRVICMGMWNQAGNMANLSLAEVKKFCPDKVYGTDYVNIGYRAGGLPWLGQAMTDFPGACGTQDFSGTALAGMPIMQGLATAKDTALWIDLGAGDPGYRATISVIGAGGVPVITAVTAVSVAEALPFFQSRQLRGLVMGLRGAAEYELLAQSPGKAISGMDAQSASHALLVLLIVLGNIGYLASKNSKKA